jgi:hypothetical protein
LQQLRILQIIAAFPAFARNKEELLRYGFCGRANIPAVDSFSQPSAAKNHIKSLGSYQLWVY